MTTHAEPHPPSHSFADRARRRLVVLPTVFAVVLLGLPPASAQTVEDGSDAAIGKADTRTILGLVGSYLDKSTEPKVSALRRAKGATTGSVICGTVNVKGKQGLYLGERGFIADVSVPSFARVPEGVELLNPRAEGFAEKEQVRQQYFAMCLD